VTEEQELASQALEAGDASALRRLLVEAPSLVEWLAGDPEGLAIELHRAARENHDGVVQVLLDLGADVNAREGFHNWTPLHTAGWHGAPDAAEVLVARGAELEARDVHDSTPLFAATRPIDKSGWAVVGLLLKSGAKLDLLSAIVLQQTHVVRALLLEQPDLLRTDPNGADLLSVALERENPGLARYLVERGADVNGCKHYSLPLIAAMTSVATYPFIEYLLAHGADPNLKPAPDQPSPLEWARETVPGVVPLLSAPS